MFDLLHLDGEDLRKRPLDERKAKLARCSQRRGRRRSCYSDHVERQRARRSSRTPARSSSKASSPSAPTRPTAPAAARPGSRASAASSRSSSSSAGGRRTRPGRPFSSLLLAVREGERLRYPAGSAAAIRRAARRLAAQFKKLARKTRRSPDVPPAIAARRAFGQAGAGRRDRVSRLDARRPVRRALQGPARGQAGVARSSRSEPCRRPSAAKRAQSADGARSAREARRRNAARSRDGADEAEVAGVRLTHPDRVLFPAQGITKRELIDYYLSVADRILPHVADRPLSAGALPGRRERRVLLPEARLGRLSRTSSSRSASRRIRQRRLLYIERRARPGRRRADGRARAAHLGLARRYAREARPHRLRPRSRRGLRLRARCARPRRRCASGSKRSGLKSFPMVTGGKGIHVVVPLTPARLGRAQRISPRRWRADGGEEPERYVANMSKAKRKGRIFVDYLRNGRGATAISPYSTRARAGARWRCR